ncbi:MAG: hypothetical protein GY871_03965 [Actinomycetales bacterium]|nr:hypothetical protein [Actinomycetales bacterium]
MSRNPFAFAIAVTGPGLYRAHWLSGSGVTARRIHAECYAEKARAELCAEDCRANNPGYTFEVRRFAR